jgi:hypothetical protein
MIIIMDTSTTQGLARQTPVAVKTKKRKNTTKKVVDIDPNAYLDFIYPSDIWFLEGVQQASLSKEYLPKIKKNKREYNGIPLKWSEEEASAIIEFKDIFGSTGATIKNIDSVTGKRFLFDQQLGHKISVAVEVHTVLYKMFAHHPKTFGLTASLSTGIWRGNGGNELFEGLSFNNYSEDKVSYIRYQIPKEYHAPGYIWIDPNSSDQGFGAFYLTLVRYNGHRKGKPSFDIDKDECGAFGEFYNCPHSDYYWALGQVGVERYHEYALWNDVAGIEVLVAKAKNEEARKQALAFTALVEPDLLAESKYKYTINQKKIEARQAFENLEFQGKVIKIRNKNIEELLHKLNELYNNFEDGKAFLNIYYKASDKAIFSPL